MKRVLFISHDAYCAGATLLFLQLLTYAKQTGKIEFEILIKNSHGRLLPDFQRIAPTSIWNRVAPKRSTAKLVLFNWIEKIRHGLLYKKLKAARFDLIFSNTITNGELLEDLSNLHLPVITQVHELGYWIEKCGPRNLELVKKNTQVYLAASRAVQRHLTSQHGIPEASIRLAYEYTDVNRLRTGQCIGGLKALLGLAPESFIVAGCGDESWRKGKDLFVPVASRVLRNTQVNVHFVWIGGKVSKEIAFDLERSGFSDRIHFVNFIPDAYRYFCDIDVFAMLSRDDPFPVVNLEIAGLGKPIVCFANSGGTPELLDACSENIIPYLDLGAMSDRLLELIHSSDTYRKDMGAKLAHKVETHFDLGQGTERILNIILEGA